MDHLNGTLMEYHALKNEYTVIKQLTAEDPPAMMGELDVLVSRLDPLAETRALSSEDIRRFSRFLIEVYPEEQLYYRARILKEKIEELSSASADKQFVEEALKDFSGKTTREERLAVVRELHRKRIFLTIEHSNSELLRRRLMLTSVYTAISMFALAFVVSITLNSGFPVLLAVAWGAGSMGAWTSLAYRIKDADTRLLARQADLQDSTRLSNMSVWIAPLFGSIGATLIIGGLKVGLLETQLLNLGFGDFKTCTSSSYWINCLVRDENFRVFYLVFLISMAAGWTERLVPDMLDWMGKKIQLDDRKS